MEIFAHPENYAYLIPALPGLAFFIIVLGLLINRKFMMRLAPYISVWAIAFAAIISTFIFLKMVTGGYADTHNYVRPWAIEYEFIGNFKIQFGIALDGISVFTVFMVSVVACLIQIYSTGYMLGDENYGRYFAFHSLFVFSMLTMVLSDNLLSFFMGWEIMGLCSYLLIGFFYYKHSAADAQKKAFLVTKIGDVGMFIGILMLGGLVLMAGIKHSAAELPEPNPMITEPNRQIEKFGVGNISLNFTNPQYEGIRATDAKIERLRVEAEHGQGHLSEAELSKIEGEITGLEAEKQKELLAYIHSMEPLDEAFFMLNETLVAGWEIRKTILQEIIPDQDFVKRYEAPILEMLNDPRRPKKVFGTKEWQNYCESLKKSDKYLMQLSGWIGFMDAANDEEMKKDWDSFCDRMKSLPPIPLSSDAFSRIMKKIDYYKNSLANRTEGRQINGNPPINTLLEPIIADLDSLFTSKERELTIGGATDRVAKLDELIRSLSFISPGELKSISDWFQVRSKEFEPKNKVYAVMLKEVGEEYDKYISSVDGRSLVDSRDYFTLRREATINLDKYATRPVPIRELVEQYDWGGLQWLLTITALLLFCGAVGKSAQFPLHVWLPDAMEGPTPVSALIHAATMVAAGVYMVGRFYFLFAAAPGALTVVAYIGAITAFGAATIGLVKYDIKRVLAYSTISQLGYMMIGLGVGSLTAGIFHLLAHAYFKALLFLGSGSVIHGSGTQDMREMGGLAKKMKWTYLTFMAGTLALCGIFPFAGFWSKDEVLGAAFNWALNGNPLNFIVFLLGVAGAFLTAFYMFRLISMTFYGKYRGEHHVHESPPSMLIPLIILAIFATLFGFVGMPFIAKYNVIGTYVSFGHGHHAFSALTAILMIVSLGIAIAGLASGLKLAYWGSPWKERMKQQHPQLYRNLVHMYYFDEFYNGVIVVGVLFLCKVMRVIDTWIIDGIVNAAAWIVAKLSWIQGRFDLFVVDGAVNLMAWIVDGFSRLIRPLQSGYVQNAMLVVVVFVLLFLMRYFIIKM